mmetsp:Transcript_43463/g.114228  ORF Transcript_43463/g.114228 Transcript_43463/m.114228 type:complete len:116 (-) Transcript_43463:426-773(-)
MITRAHACSSPLGRHVPIPGSFRRMQQGHNAASDTPRRDFFEDPGGIGRYECSSLAAGSVSPSLRAGLVSVLFWFWRAVHSDDAFIFDINLLHYRLESSQSSSRDALRRVRCGAE